MPDVSTENNPSAPTQDVPMSGDTPTQIVQGFQDKFGPAPSEGDVVTSTTEPAAPPDTTGQAKGDEPQPDIDAGKITRLEQQLSDQKRLLYSLGLDPESDVAEQLNKGLINKQDLLEQIGAIVPGKPPTAPPDPMQRVDDLISKIEKSGNADVPDLVETLKALKSVAVNVAQKDQAAAMDTLYKQCRNATETVINNEESHKNLPDDISEIESQIFLSSTDNLLATETNSNPRYLTPAAYSHYAQKNLGRLNKWRNHWIEQGKEIQRQSTTPKPGVNPISPTTGAGPISPPKPRITLDNIDEATRNWINNQAPV